jgi:hypothetical protein
MVWWCGKCNASCSRATRRFVRPLPSPARLAASPREWFPHQAHAPKAPNESNQSNLSPCPARPTTAAHDACCCTLSAFWTRWAQAGSRWPPQNGPPTSPAPVPAACMGGGPLRYAPAPGKSNNEPMGSLCARQRDTQAQKSSASVEHEGTRILTQPTYQASPSPN